MRVVHHDPAYTVPDNHRLGHIAQLEPVGTVKHFILQENDLLLLISNSGKTREIVELTQLAHNLNPELKFIVITGNPDSPLAHESNVCLSTGKPQEVCVLGMTPTTSTTAMTVIGDILVVQTMKETGFTIEDYSKRHHGGYLGEKSRSLCVK